MKVTAQEEYGLRCLLKLARHADGGKLVTVREVASSERLSPAYAEKLLRVLSRAGLAESVRGTHGGYRMARTPAEVTVGEAVRALGGFVGPEELCQRFTGYEDCCVHLRDCGLRRVWATVGQHVHAFLDLLPLTSLLEEEAAMALRLKRATGYSGTASVPPGGAVEV